MGQANNLLSTKFAVYTDGQTTKLRTTAYSIPDDLVNDIDVISPTTYFGNTKAQRIISRGPGFAPSSTVNAPTKRQFSTSCETSVVYAPNGRTYKLLSPLCLQELYNTVGYQADPKSGSTIAFGNFLGQSASYSDLAQFEKMFNIPSQNFTVLALINGGVDDQSPLTVSITFGKEKEDGGC